MITLYGASNSANYPHVFGNIVSMAKSGVSLGYFRIQNDRYYYNSQVRLFCCFCCQNSF